MKLAAATTWVLLGGTALGSPVSAQAEAGGPAQSLEAGLSRQEKLDVLAWGADRRSVCGPNAMYIWLALRGERVPFEDIEQALGRTLVGHSLLELAREAEGMGQRVRLTRRGSTADLARLRLPAIAYGTQMIEREGVRTGHYLVAHRVQDGRVHYVEPTTGVPYVTDAADFLTRVSGHFLEPARGGRFPWSALLASLLSFAVTWSLLRRRLAAAPARRRPSRSIPLALLLAFALAGRAEAEAEIWRLPGRDALHPLYLLLGFHGEDVSYPELRSRVPESGASLLDLRDAARGMDFDLRIVRRPPTLELADVLPAVVHLRHPREASGGFFLLVAVEESGVSFFEGGGSHFGTMSWEDFLRDWSGHLLVHPSRTPAERIGTLPLIAFALALGAFYASWRLR